MFPPQAKGMFIRVREERSITPMPTFIESTFTRPPPAESEGGLEARKGTGEIVVTFTNTDW